MSQPFLAIIQHLRFPFSILLLPIFLFSLSEINLELVNHVDVWILFFILHFLVYPSSNAYNSLQDQDKGSIGLIKKPLPATIELKLVTIIFDIVAILISLYINSITAIGVMVYIVFSRLYSFREIRLKKYPIIGFLTVFVFQGFWIYCLVHFSITQDQPLSILNAIVASCLIGAMYPLSQIYQHQQDKDDGVMSISYTLGYRGTFVFSGILFIIGSALFSIHHLNQHREIDILIFSISQLPIITYFLFWFYQVWKDELKANFEHTMRMNIIASVCMNTCFVILFFMKR